MDKYRIDLEKFEKFFVDKNGVFQHRVDKTFRLFPYNTKTKIKDITGIVGSFIKAIYNFDIIPKVSFDDIASSICEELDINKEQKEEFINIVKNIYFNPDGTLKSTRLCMLKYSSRNNDMDKLAKFLVSICDSEKIKEVLDDKTESSNNVLDKLIEKNISKISLSSSKKSNFDDYYCFDETIKNLFTGDFCYLVQCNIINKEDIFNLVSYYYFYYVSQTILKMCKSLNNDCVSNDYNKIYFCLGWEKTSQNRLSYKFGWNKIAKEIDKMFSHACLLNFLNCYKQVNENNKMYNYDDLLDLYNNFDEQHRKDMLEEILSLEKCYIEVNRIDNSNDVGYDDLCSLLKSFHNIIYRNIMNTSRKRANNVYKDSFELFCKSNFLQKRGKNGYMIALSEEQIILLTKVIIHDQTKITLGALFKGFEERGVYFDKISQECLVDFYDRLGLVEKKSDSGDAKYVKGIL